MKKIIKIILGIFISFLFVNFSFATEITTSIIDVDSSKNNLLKIFFDKEIISNSSKLNGDIKLFNDLEYIDIVKDIENEKIVNIKLSNDLEKNTSYSLLSVYGVEGTIDFKINDLINGLEINGDGSNGITKVTVIDSKNIQITFSKKVVGDDIDIKILKEYSIKDLKIDGTNNKVINVSLLNTLKNNSKYLIMMFTFTNKEGDNYNIENSIYDFQTKGDLKKAKEEEKEDIKEEEKTGNVALNSAETPDTGAETWILLLGTFIFSNVIYFRKKIIKK